MNKVDCDVLQCKYNANVCFDTYKIEMIRNGVYMTIRTIVKEDDNGDRA